MRRHPKRGTGVADHICRSVNGLAAKRGLTHSEMSFDLIAAYRVVIRQLVMRFDGSDHDAASLFSRLEIGPDALHALAELLNNPSF